MNRIGMYCLLAVLIFGTASLSSGQTFNFTLDGLSEVPPNASPATGFCTVLVDDPTDTVAVNCSYSGLLGPIAAAHIHAPAPPGVNAGVIIPLTPTGGTTGTILLLPTFTSQTNIDNILAGLAYVNMHTQPFPGGEIRGQITPEPASSMLILAGVALLGLGRRRK
ncbi:MAG TPA: CHRD domain-containing protein [Pirellulaceae bacterium]